MQLIEEHKTQTYLVVLQSLAIIAGTLMVTGLMKVNMPGVEVDDLPWLLCVVRSYGICLLPIPAIWSYVTVRLERSDHLNYRPVWTLVSGLVILTALALLFFVCFFAAAFPPLR